MNGKSMSSNKIHILFLVGLPMECQVVNISCSASFSWWFAELLTG